MKELEENKEKLSTYRKNCKKKKIKIETNLRAM